MAGNDILKKSSLSITQGRTELLRVLFNAHLPLSVKEIEDMIKTSCNRSTIYRNLNTLLEKGIVNRILADGMVKYKYAGDERQRQPTEGHVHFKCDICCKVFCLHDALVQLYTLPEGYIRKENQFLIVGTCQECNQINGVKR